MCPGSRWKKPQPLSRQARSSRSAQVPQKLYVEVVVTADGHTGRAVVRDLHTNVVLVEQDGVATLDKRDTDTAAAGDSDVVTPEQIASFLTVRSIWDYCTKELDPMNDPIDIIRSAVKVNSVISDEASRRNTASPSAATSTSTAARAS